MITTPKPAFGPEDKLDKKFEVLLDNYYMLRKELEYSTQNISLSDMDKKTRSHFKDIDGSIAEIITSSKAIILRLSDAEDNISTVIQTSNSISLRVKDAENNISSLQLTSTQLQSQITDNAGNISTLTQTANSLTSSVSSMEGNISTVTQKANSLETQVSTLNGNVSTIKQTSDAIALAVNANKLVFNSSGLSIYNAGISVYSGSNKVFYIDTGGTLNISGYFTGNGITVNSNGTTLTNGKFVVASTSGWEVLKVDGYNNVIARGLYIVNPQTSQGTSGSLYYSSTTIFKAVLGEVLIGLSDSNYSYYRYKNNDTYVHTFKGSFILQDSGGTYIEVRTSSLGLYLLGYKVKFDSNGFLVKA